MRVGLGGLSFWALTVLVVLGIAILLPSLFVRVFGFVLGGHGAGRPVRREVVSGVEPIDERVALSEITRDDDDIPRRALRR
jgi:hypothetical protein